MSNEANIILETTTSNIIDQFLECLDEYEEETKSEIKNLLNNIVSNNLRIMSNKIIATVRPEPKKPIEPKKLTSSYNLYINEYIEKHSSEGLKKSQLLNDASIEWNNLSDDEKEPYNERANKINNAITQETGVSSLGNRIYSGTTSSKGKSSSSDGAKKRSPSAYNLFIKKFCAENKGKGKPQSQIFKEAGATWKGLSEVEREPYVTEAEFLKQQ